MKHALLGTAFALTLFATAALAQQQPGTGGGAGGESGSSAQTDIKQGAPPTNPTAGAPAGQMGTAGSATTGTSTGGGVSSATGTGGGKGGESGSGGGH